jgi:hypothetical protein
MPNGTSITEEPRSNEEILVVVCASLCLLCCICAFVSSLYDRLTFFRQRQELTLTDEPSSFLKWCCWLWWCNSNPSTRFADHILPIAFIDLPPSYEKCVVVNIAKLSGQDEEAPPSYDAVIALYGRRLSVV